jgi:hypothetical protein
VIDVAERSFAKRPQRLARHHQHVLAQHLLDPYALGGDLLVRRGVGAERKQRRVLVGRDGFWIGKSGGGVHLMIPMLFTLGSSVHRISFGGEQSRLHVAAAAAPSFLTRYQVYPNAFLERDEKQQCVHPRRKL